MLWRIEIIEIVHRGVVPLIVHKRLLLLRPLRLRRHGHKVVVLGAESGRKLGRRGELWLKVLKVWLKRRRRVVELVEVVIKPLLWLWRHLC